MRFWEHNRAPKLLHGQVSRRLGPPSLACSGECRHLLCAWVALTAIVQFASLSDSEWSFHLFAASLAIGVAISGSILMLP